MPVLTMLLSLASAIVGAFAWVGFLCRLRGGRYRVERNDQRARFETSLTTVTFHRERQELRITGGKGENRRYALADVHEVKLDRDARSSAFELFAGWNVTDLFETYRDKRHTWTVYLQMRTGERIPVAVLRQYEIRDFLDFATPFILAILKGIGLHHEGPAVAMQLRNRLSDALRWSRGTAI